MMSETVSITPCSQSARFGSCAHRLKGGRTRVLRRMLASSLAALLLEAITPASAMGQAVKVREATLEHQAAEYQVNADFDVELGPTLEGALNAGVPLYFVLEFRLWQPRWWWFDKQIAGSDEARKLTYNALTRQYRLAIGSLHQDFTSLGDALVSLGRVRGSPSFSEGGLPKGHNYIASIGLRLDMSQLPKPFQVKAVTSSEWQLASSQFNWDVHISP
jgi:hypothetical protein